MFELQWLGLRPAIASYVASYEHVYPLMSIVFHESTYTDYWVYCTISSPLSVKEKG